MAIYLAPGANAVATAAGIKAAMERLSERFPDDLDYVVMYDTTDFVNASIEKVIHTLFEAFVLVILVVFLFLGSWRATLIPLIAVPVALIGTFAFLLMIGFSANTISLLAVVLAIGIVVDDAIVVVEAVEHIMETEGLDPRAAAKKAMTQITAPIIAITLVLLSVFLPVAFIPGITGQLFQQFAAVVAFSMLISAINALTLSPALCAILLKHGGHRRGLMGMVMRGIDGIRDGYAAIVGPAGAGLDPGAGASGRHRRLPPVGCSRSPPPASCRKRTRGPSWPRSSCPRVPRSTAPWRWPSRSRRS